MRTAMNALDRFGEDYRDLLAAMAIKIEPCDGIEAMTRLSRTYLVQMEALKKHRAKAQQTVRVERVTAESGRQAVVDSIQHGGHDNER